MKKLFKMFLPLMTVIPLVGCTGQDFISSIIGGNSGNSDSSNSATSEITTTPAFEKDSISIHYNREDKDYDGWALWLWSVGKDGAEYDFQYRDDFGALANYPLSTFGGEEAKKNGIGFIVKSKGSWDKKDFDKDRFITFSDLTPDESGVYNVYLRSEDGNIYLTPDNKVLAKILDASFYEDKLLVVEANVNMTNVKVFEDDKEILNEKIENRKIATLNFDAPMDFSKKYTIEATFETKETLKSQVSAARLYGTDAFNAKYAYDGDDLGAIVKDKTTTFKVWSPFGKGLKVNIYDTGSTEDYKYKDPNASNTKVKTIDMVKGEKGVWSASLNEDLSGKYYTYTVETTKYGVKEVVDPYAKSTGVNGQRGMIVDFSKTNPEGWEEISAHPYDRKELTVYETHIADLTSSATWNGTKENAKKFAGAHESGTTYKKGDVTVKTGFDHIKELGVNAVQLLPVFDQANDEVYPEFNWGYNPANYNTIEGAYSSNPFDGYTRIKEFKSLIKDYNKAGINIIMDVVYNHMAGADYSNFDMLVNDYYFRHDASGGLSNGSGCGNETASDHSMFRKFMIDSTAFLAKEYKLGGFRFDLMGLHDIDTMNKVVSNLKTINPNICVYGEPWTGGGSPLDSSDQAIQANTNRFEGYGQFNDQMRDALIAGGLKGKQELAWADNVTESSQSLAKTIALGIKGATSGSIVDPNKTVNYVTCHDNYTLHDRFKAAGIEDEAMIKKMAMLSNSVVFTSQGTTFMLAGEEFLRTKQGNSNSYNASYEVNELNYELKVDNKDMFDNYVKLIDFKKSVNGLHQNIKEDATMTDVDVKISDNNTVLSYVIKDTANNKEYKIFHRSGAHSTDEIKVDLTGYEIKLATVEGTKVASKTTLLKPFETIIAVK